MVRKCGDKKRKTYSVHRFVWDCAYACLHGVIPDGKVIDHVNDNKEDNRLCNLQLMTQQENCKKSAKKRDYSFAANNHRNRRIVKQQQQISLKIGNITNSHYFPTRK